MVIDRAILSEEIRLMDPTHIVFFGWYGISLQHELPELFERLYPGGLGDNSVWKNNVVDMEHEGRHYIFTYHPAWGARHKGYEDRVEEVVKQTLQSTAIQMA